MILGIDISKRTFDVTLLVEGKRQQQCAFGNTAAGIVELLAWLASQGVSELQVCMEATNTYWEAVAEALHSMNYHVSVVNPTRIKGFSMSQLRRSKTDKVDSAVIAAYCARMQPEAWQPLAETQRQLRALERHRQDLHKSRKQYVERQKSTQDSEVRASLQRVLEALDAEIKVAEQQADALTQQDAALRAKKELLLSIVGIGPRSANLLLAEMGDLAAYTNARAVAADAGVTPAHYQSGTTVRRRPKVSKVGKAAVRGQLWMPALNAMRTNPILRSFAARLRARHKPEKVIICAVIRKLLHLAYGVLKNNTPFDHNYGLVTSSA